MWWMWLPDIKDRYILKIFPFGEKKFLHLGKVFANMYGIKTHLCLVRLHGYVRGLKHLFKTCSLSYAYGM